MRDRPDCKARRVNDQMVCGTCGIQWDIDDDDPPGCVKPKIKPEDPVAGILDVLGAERKPNRN